MTRMNDCGGCEGKGSHRRWCPEVVGWRAARRGVWSERAGAMADEVGANSYDAANALYTAAAILRMDAYAAAELFNSALGVKE